MDCGGSERPQQDESRTWTRSRGSLGVGLFFTVCSLIFCSFFLVLLTMEEKFQRLLYIPVAAALFLMIGYQYVCPPDTSPCYFRTDPLLHRHSPGFRLEEEFEEEQGDGEEDGGLSSRITARLNFSERDMDRRVQFNIRGDDVMVFLHIQKTGGTTFGRHLVKNIHLERPCNCTAGQRKCTCHRPGKAESWLFSRFSTGWSCGLHADWTELSSCVPVVMSQRDRKKVQKKKKR